MKQNTRLAMGTKVVRYNDTCIITSVNEDGTYNLRGIEVYNNVKESEFTVIPFVDKLQIGDTVINTEGVKGAVKGIAKYIHYVEFEDGTSGLYIHQEQESSKILSMDLNSSKSIKLDKVINE